MNFNERQPIQKHRKLNLCTVSLVSIMFVSMAMFCSGCISYEEADYHEEQIKNMTVCYKTLSCSLLEGEVLTTVLKDESGVAYDIHGYYPYELEVGETYSITYDTDVFGRIYIKDYYGKIDN